MAELILTEPVPCTNCQTHNYKPVFQAQDRLHGIPGEFNYVRCAHCGLMFINPRPKSDEAAKLYPDSYNPHEVDSEPPKKNRFVSFVRRSIVERLKGVHLGHIFRSLRPESRVLDVGCGSGKYLHSIREDFGCQVYGIDFSKNASDAARKLYSVEVEVGHIHQTRLPPESFDLITAWWYLEHVPNTEEVLKKINSLLKGGGTLVIGVPNSQSLNARLFRDKWYHLDCPRHYNLWTPDSLSEVLSRNGFRVDAVKYDKTPWGLLGSLQYVLFKNNFDSRYKDYIRGNPVLALLLLPITFTVWLCGGSDIMTLHCSKLRS